MAVTQTFAEVVDQYKAALSDALNDIAAAEGAERDYHIGYADGYRLMRESGYGTMPPRFPDSVAKQSCGATAGKSDGYRVGYCAGLCRHLDEVLTAAGAALL